MNLGSWIVLALVGAVLFAAVRATFFKKAKTHGGCCDMGDNRSSDGVFDTSLLTQEEQTMLGFSAGCGGGCEGCSCSNVCSAVMKNAVLPIVKE